MICFRCGEKNPESYRFCGMCGSLLQTSKAVAAAELEATRAEPVPHVAAVATAERRTETLPLNREEKVAKSVPVAERVEPISGPSLLGLNDPTLDSLREKAFSSAEDTYYEPVGRRVAWGRLFMLLLVLCGVAGAAWLHYSSSGIPVLTALKQLPTKPEPKTNAPAVNPAPANIPDQNGPDKTESPAPPPAATTPAPTATSEPVPNSVKKADETQPAEAANETPTAASAAKSDSAKPVENPRPKEALASKPATTVVAKNSDAPAKAARPAPTPVAPDDGDALFKRGEAYLYGRGVPENCDQATKYLKAASEKSHAKARSAFGTMYATGHCVPRDLPSSYRWFALALRVDPNNQILEKDLSAVWNQMTPPERQLATKSQ